MRVRSSSAVAFSRLFASRYGRPDPSITGLLEEKIGWYLMDGKIVVQGDLGANEYVFAVPAFEVEQAKYVGSI